MGLRAGVISRKALQTYLEKIRPGYSSRRQIPSLHLAKLDDPAIRLASGLHFIDAAELHRAIAVICRT